MKIKKSLLFLTPFLLSVSVVSISCSIKSKEFYDDLELNDTFVINKSEYNKVGKIFDKKIQYKKIVNWETQEVKTVEETLWEFFSGIEGTVESIADGDTLTVKVDKQLSTNKGIPKKGQLVKVRIPLIDTLEQNTSDVKEREKKLSHLDWDYVKSIIPIGSKVRLISDNLSNNSYDRIVSYVFFGQNFEKNFSIEMLANGWTLPRIGKDEFKTFTFDFKKDLKSSVASYLIPFAAYAFNFGYTNKKGFYAKEGVNITLNNKEENIKFNYPQDLSNEYKSHGEDLMNDAYRFLYPFNIERNKRKIFLNKENNFYEFLRFVNKK
ncbi:thermonuclease family protein [Metamycoplasma canadense]|uniref:TNase-like domain-containing protein n=1 Tax=Metamycoplasma canadense TaxID=29554 RepID=A0A077L5T6_9BACT|nr:thermonuclease family protein [Metamycoplasma canadense]BAP39650.1 hypothetical protein MCAN360_0534 [Metamycoplasma canadense]